MKDYLATNHKVKYLAYKAGVHSPCEDISHLRQRSHFRAESVQPLLRHLVSCHSFQSVLRQNWLSVSNKINHLQFDKVQGRAEILDLQCTDLEL